MKTGKLLALMVALLAIAGLLSACVPRMTQTEPPTVPTPSPTVLAPSPAATPTRDRAGDDVALLTWHREGGIAGFCDDLVVYADGQVAISLCKDSQPRAQKSLSGEQMEQLRGWVETYQSFEFEQRDEAVADGMAVRMTFAGKGSQEATEADKQAMLAFAAALASSAPVPTSSPTSTPVPTAIPEPTNTPLATATVAPTTTSTPTALPLSRTIPSEEVKELRIIDRFLELDVRRVSPTHCTGERAIAMFADVYGEAYVEGGVGRVITIGGGSLPPLPAPTSTPTPLPASVYLEPMNHQWQTHNNCFLALEPWPRRSGLSCRDGSTGSVAGERLEDAQGAGLMSGDPPGQAARWIG